MQLFWNEVLRELSAEWPDATQVARITVRLSLALLLTGIIGWNRERGRKTAGLRTHLLVALGSALFVVAALEALPNAGDVARVIQGVATGIGFIGSGAIIKLEGRSQVRGLTTAGSIWLAAAIGVAAGLGKIGAAAVGLVLAWLILAGLENVEKWLRPHKAQAEANEGESTTPPATPTV